MLRFEHKYEGELDAGRRAALPRLRLTFDQRSRSRLAASFDDGTGAAILLPRGGALRDGDILCATTGDLARIESAPEALLKIRAASGAALLRALYHLANRHVPVQIAPEHLLIEPDPVLARLLQHLGAAVEEVEAPFDPEPGAYHGHEHAHAGEDSHAAPADSSAGVGERLSIEAHSRGSAGR
ncbi:MAG TPA: urease accessory protein UreE [Burkholderiaceae bacterium]